MKRLLMVVLYTFLIGCETFSQFQHFRGEYFSFSYPKEWTIDTKNTFIDIISPNNHPEESGRESLTISSEQTDGMSLDQCYKKYVTDWYEDQHQGEVKREGTSLINGKKAKWMEYEYGVKNSRTTLVYLIFSEDKFFLIRTASSTKRFPEYKEEFEGIINSFKVIY